MGRKIVDQRTQHEQVLDYLRLNADYCQLAMKVIIRDTGVPESALWIWDSDSGAGSGILKDLSDYGYLSIHTFVDAPRACASVHHPYVSLVHHRLDRAD